MIKRLGIIANHNCTMKEVRKNENEIKLNSVNYYTNFLKFADYFIYQKVSLFKLSNKKENFPISQISHGLKRLF